jgi:hypothetical protein
MKKRYSLNSPNDWEGFWISPDGEFIPVSEHLISIQQEPERFWLTKRDVADASINDLRKIAVELIKSGWIRFRFFGSNYLFEINSVSTHNNELMEEALLKAEAVTKENITIETMKPRKTYSGTVGQFFDRTLFKYYANPKRKWRLS